MAQSTPHFKIVMLGNSGVGKTALVERISDDIFADAHVPTVGAQFIAIDLTVNQNQCTLELWDTAGQEVFRSLVGFYTREAKGAFLLFDLTDPTSFNDLPQWMDFVKENSPGAKVILFGNKKDLTEKRMVQQEDITAFAEKHDLVYYEGSAKTSENVRDAFERMGELVYENSNQTNKNTVQIEPTQETGKKKKGCCK